MCGFVVKASYASQQHASQQRNCSFGLRRCYLVAVVLENQAMSPDLGRNNLDLKVCL